MTTLFPLWLPSGLGFLVLCHLLHKSNLPKKLFLILSISPALGLGLVSLIAFWSYVIGRENGKTFTFIFAYLSFFLALAPFLSKMKFQEYQNRFTCLHFSFKNLKKARFHLQNIIKTFVTAGSFLWLLFSIYRFLQYYINYISWNVYGGWDARYMWNIKARFYVRSPGAWIDLFSHPKPLWTLPDYPHLLPASVAWGWLNSGSETLIWPSVIGCVFILSICSLAVWYLSAYQKYWKACLAGAFFITVPAFRFWSTTQYADIPLSFFITAAGVIFACAYRHKERALFLLAGILAGLGAWTKNEGVLFCFIMFAIGTISLFDNRANERKEKMIFLSAWLPGLLLPLASTFYIKLFLGGGGIYLNTTRSVLDYLHLLSDFSRTQFIAAAFFLFFADQSQWNYLWLFFFTSIIIFFMMTITKKKVDSRWIILACVILLELGYFLIFQISPIDLKSHIKWSMLRLLLHTGALALIFAFEILGTLERKSSN